ncbi:GNAT family N-acetyltransferase [Lacticigenium naphthae]|uniref:GNAT family N-acetyltransferase n=1 Tax=Lacticigenium naphthae TaxID=515351 RepID=UPI00040A9A08|nr:GNAT family N-acetyltransferase [Lacticigenium naphthae]
MKIEEMQEEDVKQVSEIVAHALKDKFQETLSIPERTLQKLVKLLWISEAEAYGMKVYVAKEKDTIYGAYGITYKPTVVPSVRLLAKVKKMTDYIGWKDMQNFLTVSRKTRRRPGKGEAFIDFVAVREDARDQKIGHLLMTSISSWALRRRSVKELTLYVLKENERAHHLYEKFGFQVDPAKEKKNYRFFRQVLK